MLLLSPLVWICVAYWSVVAQSPALLVGAYLTISAYTLVTIWRDENLSARQRLRLSLYTPAAYFLFYVMEMVQLISILRCLANPRALFRGSETTTWSSPQRSGSLALDPAV